MIIAALKKLWKKPEVYSFYEFHNRIQRINQLHRKLAVLKNELKHIPDDPDVVESIRVYSDELERLQRKHNEFLKKKVQAN